MNKGGSNRKDLSKPSSWILRDEMLTQQTKQNQEGNMKYRKGLMIMALVGVMVAATALSAAAAYTYVVPAGPSPKAQGNPAGGVSFVGYDSNNTNYAFGDAVQFTFFGATGISTAFDPALGKTYTGGGSDLYGGTYDALASAGGDDVMVGFINTRTTPVASITLTGSGNGGGLFAFDGDDNFGATGVTITGVNAAKDTGTVNFAGGLAPGATSWFAFESSPNSLQQGGGSFGAPLPPSLLLFGSGLVGLAGWRRYRKN
jgi:hypothetical protein